MTRLPGLVLLFATVAGHAADLRLPDYERVELANGTVLLLSEKHDVPLIGLRAAIRGGAVADPAGKDGLAQLYADVIRKGAGRRDAAAFAEAAAAVGGRISAAAGRESITIGAEFLSRDAELMIGLVTDMLRRPALATDAFEKERARSIDRLRSAKDADPSGLMAPYADAFLYGAHPYGNAASGSESSLAAIEHDDLTGFLEEQVGGDRLVVAVVGDFETGAMKARLTSVFESWRPAAAPLPQLAEPVRTSGRRVLLVDKPGATQTYFRIGNLSVALDYPQRAELDIANTLFGGRFTSMLMTVLRVEHGLTYGAGSRVVRHTRSGSATIRSFTGTASTVEAVDLAIDTLERLHTKGVDDEMIASARNYIMGQFPPTLETASALADELAFLELNGLDRAYVDDYGAALAAATPVTVHNTISDVYPGVDDLAIVLIGDAAAVREAVQKYGPVTEMSITEPRFRP